MTFLAQTEVPDCRCGCPAAIGSTCRTSPARSRSIRRHAAALEQRRFKSTPHRALPPVGRERYAIPFFLGPRFDQRIECLPTCTGPDNPPRWEPITYAEWQEYWYDANYDPKLQCDVA
jgi:hypothetical protein